MSSSGLLCANGPLNPISPLANPCCNCTQSQSAWSCPLGKAMRRRDFVKGIAVSSVWPLAAQAQQRSMPVIGFLNGRAPANLQKLLAAFRQGLNETGYIEGQNCDRISLCRKSI